jgi:hypothetical protein
MISKIPPKKNILQKARENKIMHGFLIVAYLLIIFALLINLRDWQIPILNVNYANIHNPTDYYFLQTYPPSVDGIEVGNADETIIFQVHIHADTMVMENTQVNIEAEAGVGRTYLANTSSIGIGFFGADYIPSEQTNFNPAGSPNWYELWTGWAGERLHQNVKPETMQLMIPQGGAELGGSNTTVFWREAGNKPITIVLSWANSIDFPFTYTYQFSTITVHAYADLRTSQIADTGLIGTVGLALFGVFEVYPAIKGRREEQQ